MHKIFSLVILSLLVTSCKEENGTKGPSLKPVPFSSIKGWDKDDQAKALPAFKKSCEVFQKREGTYPLEIAGNVSDWIPICEKLDDLPKGDTKAARKFFETYFTAYQIREDGKSKAFFTGYYEPEIRGSYEQTSQFNVPVYKKPEDLIVVEDLGIFNPALRGRRISGRIKDGKLVPYDSHEQILHGSLQNQGLELLWTDSHVDHFFAQVQGSTKVRMTDGTIKRIGYAGSNGHPYTSIGKFLVQKGAFTVEQASMQAIRKWFQENPDQVESILSENASFIFFRELESADEDGPEGTMGVSLTPRRSLAVDQKFTPLGIPVWIDFGHPVRDKKSQRLVVAQDTGGAIKGPLRADMFWGSGAKATEYAGQMRSQGEMYILLPKHLNPSFK